MIDAVTLAQMNGEYLTPADAGPAWHMAQAYGLDLSLLDVTLPMSDEGRLLAHQRALNRVLEFTNRDHAPAE